MCGSFVCDRSGLVGGRYEPIYADIAKGIRRCPMRPRTWLAIYVLSNVGKNGLQTVDACINHDILFTPCDAGVSSVCQTEKKDGRNAYLLPVLSRQRRRTLFCGIFKAHPRCCYKTGKGYGLCFYREWKKRSRSCCFVLSFRDSCHTMGKPCRQVDGAFPAFYGNRESGYDHSALF